MILAFCVIVYALAINQTFINKLKRDRYFDHLTPSISGKNSFYQRIFIRSDRWRYGDLYGLSYLHAYKFQLEPFRQYAKKTAISKAGKILYIIGDSFLADKTLQGAFDNFDDVIFLDRRYPLPETILDKTKQNYLVMEFAERNLVSYNLSGPKASDEAGMPVNIADRISRAVFNKDLSRNIDLLLFDDRAFTPVKELKAAINYDLFGRVAKEVAVSTDKKRLMLAITVDTSFRESAFRKITDAEIKTICGNLKNAEKYYRSKGFKAVFLSIVPNAVSIYDYRRMPYNHLLERVEKNIDFPVISIFSVFQKSPENLFYRSDAHWNPEGLNKWVSVTNKTIKNR